MIDRQRNSLKQFLKSTAMSILPKNIFETTSNGNGGFTTREWSYGDYLDMKFVNLLIILVFALAIGAIASGTLLFLTIYAYDEKDVSYNIAGIVIAGYLLFDIYKAWFISLLLSVITNDQEIEYVVYLNMAFLLSLGIMAIYRNNIYEWIQENHKDSPKRMYALIITIALGISLL